MGGPTHSAAESVQQMEIAGIYGESEVLWVKPEPRAFVVVVPPVVAYGVSVGTRIEAQPTSDPWYRMVRVIAPSTHGTIRAIMPNKRVASETYRSIILPRAQKEGLVFGRAAFLDPMQVSLDVPAWERQARAAGELFDDLERTECILEWEIADPVEATPIPEAAEVGMLMGRRIMHPRPGYCEHEDDRA